MPRAATGTAFKNASGRWYVRVVVAAGKSGRRAFPLPEQLADAEVEPRRVALADLAAALRERGAPIETAERALARAAAEATPAGMARAAMQIRAGKTPIAAGLGREATWGDVAERWIGGDLARLYPDHVRPLRRTRTIRSYLDRYLIPAIGDVPLVSFGVEDALRASAALPEHLQPSTRAVILSCVSRVLTLSVFPLRLREGNPIPKNFRPKGKKRVRPFLRPAEDRQLLACRAVRLCWRILYGFLAREGLRFDEARLLDVGDVDRAAGTVNLGGGKTDDPRTWALGADVVRALDAWIGYRETKLGRALRRDEPLFVGVTGDRLYRPRADRLREHLELAELDRAELYARTSDRRPFRVHDLRATFVTLSLANGRTETWVADRTGHKTSEMIARYRRAARTAAELGLGWLDPLDEAIPELAAGSVTRIGTASPRRAENAGAQCDPGSFSTFDPPPAQGADPPEKAPPETHAEPLSPAPRADSRDDSRADLAADLSRRVGALLAAGDLEAARIAHRALGELLGLAGPRAGVVDLETARRERGR